jgi:hypothetical protein
MKPTRDNRRTSALGIGSGVIAPERKSARDTPLPVPKVAL